MNFGFDIIQINNLKFVWLFAILFIKVKVALL